MHDDNPFAAPQSDLTPEHVVPPQGEVWRSGKVLVFLRDASLPARCIKCNATDDLKMYPRKLYYYPPWVLLLILVNLLVLLIVAMIVRKTATASLGLCRECRRCRRNAIVFAWLCLAASVASFVSIAVLPESLAWAPLIAGILFFVSGIIVGLGWGQLLTVNKIDKAQVRLTRISPKYLDMLPVGP